MSGFVATAQTTIDASRKRVWQALTDPDLVARYMFGSTLRTDWKPGSPITWSGEFDGRSFVDKGEVVAIDPGQRLEVTHFSPLSGQADEPANYHHLEYTLQPAGNGTRLVLTQDNSASQDEADHSAAMWQQMLDGLKEVAEQS